MTDSFPRARAVRLGATTRPATPPRVIPRLLNASLRLRGWDVQISWLLAVLGMATCLAILPRVHLDPTRYSFGTTGTILQITDDVVTYSYPDQRGVPRRGRARVRAPIVAPVDNLLTVYFDPVAPDHSIIAQSEPMVGPGALALLILPVGALILATVFMTLRGRRLVLVRYGREARGAILRKRILGNVETTLAYDHELDGVTRNVHVGFVRVIVEDEANVAVIYDPADPEEALALDALPGRPRIRDGRVVTTERQSLAPFVLPALTLAAAIMLVIKTV